MFWSSLLIDDSLDGAVEVVAAQLAADSSDEDEPGPWGGSPLSFSLNVSIAERVWAASPIFAILDAGSNRQLGQRKLEHLVVD